MTQSDPTPPPPARRRPLAAWAQLLRLPNLFTVPGDPLAGFALAGGLATASDLLTVLPCAVAAVLLYCAGMILNDVFDRTEDARDRPTRPIPAGEVRPRDAVGAVGVLMIGGIALAATVSPSTGGVAGAIAAMVLLYDAGGKRIRLWGPINMGLCRGGSFLMGTAAAGWRHGSVPGPDALVGPLPIAVLIATPVCCLVAYIAMLTYLASHEAGPAHRTGMLRNVPPETIQKAVGWMIRLLVVYQAITVASAGSAVGWIVAVCLLAGGAVSVMLAKRFYAS